MWLHTVLVDTSWPFSVPGSESASVCQAVVWQERLGFNLVCHDRVQDIAILAEPVEILFVSVFVAEQERNMPGVCRIAFEVWRF